MWLANQRRLQVVANYLQRDRHPLGTIAIWRLRRTSEAPPSVAALISWLGLRKLEMLASDSCDM
jgi:hypothetical protein